MSTHPVLEQCVSVGRDSPRTSRRPQVPEFHWLRSIACLGVVTIHALVVASGYPGNRIVLLGFSGMVMILMFSTPTFVFLSAAQAGYAYERPPVGFLRKRVRYILVPYITINLAYGAFETLIAHRQAELGLLIGKFGAASLANLLGGSHLWFIIPIFQFYLLFPLFSRWARKGPPVTVLVAAFVLNTAYLLTFHIGAPIDNAYSEIVGRHWYSFFFPAWIFYFTAGMMIGASYERFRALVGRHSRPLYAAVLLSACFLLWLHFSGILHDVSSRRADMLLYAGAMIPALLYLGSRLERIPRALVLISHRAFGIYLLHPFFLELVWRGFPLERLSAPGALVTLMVVGVGAAYTATEVLSRLPGGSLLVGRVRRFESQPVLRGGRSGSPALR